MSRSFLSFLAFLCALVAVFTLGALWMGPTVVSLALDNDLRNQPYYVVHLVNAPQPDADDAGEGYFVTLNQLVHEDQGQLLWRGVTTSVHSGRLADEFDDALIFEFAGAGDLVQMLTGVSYRALTKSVQPLLLGTTAPSAPLAQDETLILWLLQSRQSTMEQAAQALEGVIASAADYAGQRVWDTPVDVIAGGRDWDYLVMLAFPGPRSARGWLNDLQTNTERALVRRHFLQEAMLELNSGQYPD